MSDSPRSIVLIGFMGSGKSAVGRLLARECDWLCFDTDEMAAAMLGMSITEIFAQLGEARFREAEAVVLRKMDASRAAVIVTGGGIVLCPENVERLRALGTVVWLTADFETLVKRLARRKDRPLLQTRNPAETIATLLEQRKNFYAKAADFIVDTSQLNHRQVVQAIRDGLQSIR